MVAESRIGKVSLNWKAILGLMFTAFVTGLLVGAFAFLWTKEGFKWVHLPLLAFFVRGLWVATDKISQELKKE